MSRRHKATIRDVATAAGVAVGTVSRVLNGSGAVAPQTASRVRQAIAVLGFMPDAAGRSLRSGASRAIGVLVPTLSNPIFARSLEGIERAAAQRGFSTVIASSGYDPVRELDVVATLVARGVEGLVLTLTDTKPDRIDAVAGHGVPFVLAYNQPKPNGGAPRFSLATVDSRVALQEATEQLIALGHRRVAFLGGAFASSDRSRARYEGYRAAMDAAGLPAWDPAEIPFDAQDEAFEAALGDLIGRLVAPTALICSNDLLGLHAVAAARRHGLAVPGDLSVVGFDGMPMARIAEPSLATVAQPARRMGEAAVDLLFGLIAGGPPRQLILPHTFLEGGTLAAARADADPLRAGSATILGPTKPNRSPR
ncbi:GntR family transcriptional regulator [Salinarimonas ramus]|uniref:GntR family transcriptional regulator n=1 Tax=Salinarimonas ramus TaxID=690164 RepID=A0A917V9A8_9HYPH|nr:GntR family transcriptional regulator [Salinarimonas ramus]